MNTFVPNYICNVTTFCSKAVKTKKRKCLEGKINFASRFGELQYLKISGYQQRGEVLPLPPPTFLRRLPNIPVVFLRIVFVRCHC